MARQDFFAFEIPSVCDRRELLDPHDPSRLLGHGAQLIAIAPVVRDLVRHDQMVLRVDRCLHVVADHSAAAGFHRAGIGIGQGDLFVRCFVELYLDSLEFPELSFQGRDIVVKAFGFDLCHGRFMTISSI